MIVSSTTGSVANWFLGSKSSFWLNCTRAGSAEMFRAGRTNFCKFRFGGQSPFCLKNHKQGYTFSVKKKWSLSVEVKFFLSPREANQMFDFVVLWSILKFFPKCYGCVRKKEVYVRVHEIERNHSPFNWKWVFYETRFMWFAMFAKWQLVNIDLGQQWTIIVFCSVKPLATTGLKESFFVICNLV